jgi:hypothetical protein
MRLFWANPAEPSYPAEIHRALRRFADECRSTLPRLIAYVGTLALPAILGIYLWGQIPAGLADGPAARPGRGAASLSYPSFAVSQFDLAEKTATYEVLRHPEGGRKDASARRDLILHARQDAGFHATFCSALALL